MNRIIISSILSVFLVMLLALNSCESSTKVVGPVPVIPVESGELMPLGELVDSIQYVFLQTSSDYVVANVDKLVVSDRNIFVLDKEILESLFIFNKTGQVLNIMEVGLGGPEEFTSLDDFDYDSVKDLIYILNNDRQRLLSYTFQGELVKSYQLDFYAEKFKVSNGKAVFYRNNELYSSDKYENNQLIVYDLEKEEVSSMHLPLVEEIRYRAFHDSVDPFDVDVNLFFNQSLNDTIYTLTENGLNPVYRIDFGTKSYSKIASQIQGIEEFLYSERRQESRYTMGDLLVNNRYLISLFYSGERYAYVFYDKRNAKARTMPGFKNDIDEIPVLYLKALEENFMISVLPGEYINGYLDSKEGSELTETERYLQQGLQNTFQNPVLQILYFKSE